MRIIVAGIHTDVGKTVVSAILTEALGGRYWKPVQCGPCNEKWIPPQSMFPSTFSFRNACSPHLAAKKEGVRITASQLIPPSCSHPLIIEGTGGILSPLNESETWVDAALQWEGHWILVHRHYLGSLNHFLLTIEAMKSRNLPLLGVIFNGKGDVETEEMLLKKTQTRVLGKLAWQKKLCIQTIARKWGPLGLQEIKRASGILSHKSKQQPFPFPL